MSKACFIVYEGQKYDESDRNGFVRYWYGSALVDGLPVEHHDDVCSSVKPSVDELRKRLARLNANSDSIREALRSWITGRHPESVTFPFPEISGTSVMSGAQMRVKEIGEDNVVLELLDQLTAFVNFYDYLVQSGNEPVIEVG